MHWIPESWSHLHILVSVFPSVGLVFALVLYVTSMKTGNEGMKRSCLILLGLLGILAIPTYFSGLGSMATLSQNPEISQDLMNAHYAWGMWALAVLSLLGVTAIYEMWQYRSSGQISNNALHRVLGLVVATLAIMVMAGLGGWEINHDELDLARGAGVGASGDAFSLGIGTPQGWSHVHIILNHFPTVGFVISLAFFIAGLAMNNVLMKRSGLVGFVICAILGASTYVTGAVSMWALTDPPYPGVTQAAIDSHRDMALWTLFGLGFTGIAAWFELWRFRHLARFSSRALYTVLAFAVVTLGIMAETGHRGGLVNHPEIRVDPMPTDSAAFWSPQIELDINTVMWFVPWQTVHFFGYSLVFGAVLAVVLRCFGFWRALPFSAVHRLLPLGVFGVAMNVFTGMLMLMADTYRYGNANAFTPKMILLPIGVIAVLYFSLSDRLWAVKAGEDTPMLAKWVAVIVLLSWFGVIMGGRLLPYV